MGSYLQAFNTEVTMSRLRACLLSSFQISIVLTAALIDEDSVLEQSGDYSGDYIDKAESFSKLPQSRVLFNDEISYENDDSSEIDFNESEIGDDNILKQMISFVDPENKSNHFEMTIKEINDIFGKKKKKRGLKNKSKLSQQEKKAARNCRRKKLLYSLKDKKCHEPTTSGPCRNNKWFVAIKGKLQGVCRRIPCTNEDTPILYNETCSPIYGVCPDRQRLFLNKKERDSATVMKDSRTTLLMTPAIENMILDLVMKEKFGKEPMRLRSMELATKCLESAKWINVVKGKENGRMENAICWTLGILLRCV